MRTFKLNEPRGSEVNLTPYELEAANHPEYGGPAVLRMILNSAQVDPNAPGIPDGPSVKNLPNQVDQAMLYNAGKLSNVIGEPAGVWNLDPQAMQQLLNDKDQGPRGYVQYINAANDQAGANQKLVFTLDHYKVAPAVLVGGGPQWVAATGYQAEDNGTLAGMFIHDPSENGPGVNDHFIAATTWNSTWFRPVRGGTNWRDQFVSVCDPQPEVADIAPPVRRPKRPGDQILPPDEAVALAQEAIEEFEMTRDPSFREAIERGRPGEPRLVQDLEQDDTFYYVVPFVHPDDQRTALAAVCVDGRYGDLWSAAANPEGLPLFRVTPEEALELVRRHTLVDREPIGDVVDRVVRHTLTWSSRLRTAEPETDAVAWLREAVGRELTRASQPSPSRRLRRETLEVAHTLVWQVSQAGVNPLYPFYVVTSPNRTYYVKAADGAVYGDLIKAVFLTLGG